MQGRRCSARTALDVSPQRTQIALLGPCCHTNPPLAPHWQTSASPARALQDCPDDAVSIPPLTPLGAWMRIRTPSPDMCREIMEFGLRVWGVHRLRPRSTPDQPLIDRPTISQVRQKSRISPTSVPAQNRHKPDPNSTPPKLTRALPAHRVAHARFSCVDAVIILARACRARPLPGHTCTAEPLVRCVMAQASTDIGAGSSEVAACAVGE